MFGKSAMTPIKSGFTLIEILVTISIIALLTMVGLTNFKVANQKARDGRRQGDLEQIKAALELYRTDVGLYPTTALWPGTGGTLSAGGTTYMETIPDDPITSRNYPYTSTSGTIYTLCAGLELTSAAVAGCGSCGSGTTCTYKVTSPL